MATTNVDILTTDGFYRAIQNMIEEKKNSIIEKHKKQALKEVEDMIDRSANEVALMIYKQYDVQFMRDQVIIDIKRNKQ